MILDKRTPIAVLALDFPPFVGGIARYLYNIVSNLPDAEVRVICLPATDGIDFNRNSPLNGFNYQSVGILFAVI
jgi:hypothetical protein